MKDIGEAVHVHYGKYMTYGYGNESEEQEDFTSFFENTEIGENDYYNHIIILGNKKKSKFLWSTFSSPKGIDTSGGGYQHSVFLPNNLMNLWCADKLINFPFINVEECYGYTVNLGAFCFKNRKNLIDSRMHEGGYSDVTIPRELLIKLVCYCVGKIRTGSKNFLCVLVPEEAVDYQAYCRNIILQILEVIPAGLRNEISISTNPVKSDEKKFGIIFKKDTQDILPNTIAFHRDIDVSFLEKCFLDDEYKEMLRTSVENSAFAEFCYTKFERHWKHIENINEEEYLHNYKLWKLEKATINSDLLRLFNCKIKESMDDDVICLLRKRIENKNQVELAIKSDEAFKDIVLIKDLLKLIEDYKYVLSLLFRERNWLFSDDFSKEIFGRIWKEDDGNIIKQNDSVFQKNKAILSVYFPQKVLDVLEKKGKCGRLQQLMTEMKEELEQQNLIELLNLVREKYSEEELGKVYKTIFANIKINNCGSSIENCEKILSIKKILSEEIEKIGSKWNETEKELHEQFDKYLFKELDNCIGEIDSIDEVRKIIISSTEIQDCNIREKLMKKLSNVLEAKFYDRAIKSEIVKKINTLETYFYYLRKEEEFISVLPNREKIIKEIFDEICYQEFITVVEYVSAIEFVEKVSIEKVLEDEAVSSFYKQHFRNLLYLSSICCGIGIQVDKRKKMSVLYHEVLLYEKLSNFCDENEIVFINNKKKIDGKWERNSVKKVLGYAINQQNQIEEKDISEEFSEEENDFFEYLKRKYKFKGFLEGIKELNVRGRNCISRFI